MLHHWVRLRVVEERLEGVSYKKGGILIGSGRSVLLVVQAYC